MVSFGRHSRKDAWAATRTVHVTNLSPHEETYEASFSTPPDITIGAVPSVFTLGSGASRDVVLNAAISAEAGQSLTTFSHGGRVTFSSDDDTVQVPWVAVEGADVLITYQNPSVVLWSCDSGPGMCTIEQPAFSHELLLPNARCDLLLLALHSETAPGPLIVKSLSIDDDMEIPFLTTDAPYEVRLAGVDETGGVISRESDTPAAPYFSEYVLELPPTSRFLGELSLEPLGSDPLMVSDLDDGFTLTAWEQLFDFPHHRMYSIDHPQLHGVHESVTLSSLPSDLHHAQISVRPRRDGTLLTGFNPNGSLLIPTAAMENGWRGDVYITPQVGTEVSGVGLAETRQSGLALATPMIRWFSGRIVASSDLVPSPAAYGVEEGGTLVIGETPLWPSTLVEARSTAFRISTTFRGPANEIELGDGEGLTYEIRDAAGALLDQGTASFSFSADFERLGAYRASIRTQEGLLVDLAFDISLADSNPPIVTSLRIINDHGDIISRVPPGASAALVLSVIDQIVDEYGIPRDSGEAPKQARVLARPRRRMAGASSHGDGRGSWRPW